MLQRSLLAGALWLGLLLCLLSLKALLHYRQQQQVAPFIESKDVVRVRAAGLEVGVSSERHIGDPVPVAHALTDSLLLCLLSEALDDPTPPHIQHLINRLEKVMEALQRADLLHGRLQRGGVQEDPALTDRLKHIYDYLQQRVESLHTLLQAQEEYRDSLQTIREGVEHRWEQLVGLHVRITMEKGRVGEEDIQTVLGEVESLSMELGHCRTKLQQCRTHLNDSTHILQELGSSQRGLGVDGNVKGEFLWTERLLQSSTAQFEEIQHNFLSLENVTSCFQTHLLGLQANEMVKKASGACPDLSSPPCTSSPCTFCPSDTPSPPSCPPPVPADQLPTAAYLTLCERLARCLCSAVDCLHGSLRRM